MVAGLLSTTPIWLQVRIVVRWGVSSNCILFLAWPVSTEVDKIMFMLSHITSISRMAGTVVDVVKRFDNVGDRYEWPTPAIEGLVE